MCTWKKLWFYHSCSEHGFLAFVLRGHPRLRAMLRIETERKGSLSVKVWVQKWSYMIKYHRIDNSYGTNRILDANTPKLEFWPKETWKVFSFNQIFRMYLEKISLYKLKTIYLFLYNLYSDVKWSELSNSKNGPFR